MPLEPKSVFYAGSDSPVETLLAVNRRTKDMFTATWCTTGNIRKIGDIPMAATTIFVFSMALARVTNITDKREQITSCVEGIQVPTAFSSIQNLLPLNGSLEISEFSQLFKFLPEDEATLLKWASDGTLRKAALEISTFANANRVVCIPVDIQHLRGSATASRNLQTFTTVQGSFSNSAYDVKCNPLPKEVHYNRKNVLVFGTLSKPEDPFLWDPFISDGKPLGCIVSPGRKINENPAIYGLLIFSFWIPTDVSLNDARTKHCLRYELSCTSAEVDGLVNRTNIVINNNIPAVTLIDTPSNSVGNVIADKQKVKINPNIGVEAEGERLFDDDTRKQNPNKSGSSPGPKGNRRRKGFGNNNQKVQPNRKE